MQITSKFVDTDDTVTMLRVHAGVHLLIDGAHRLCATTLYYLSKFGTDEKPDFSNIAPPFKIVSKLLKGMLTSEQLSIVAGYKNMKTNQAAKILFSEAVSYFFLLKVFFC